MEDPDRPGDHACPHTLVTSIPDGIHKHKHTHNVNRWIEAKWTQGSIHMMVARSELRNLHDSRSSYGWLHGASGDNTVRPRA